jgi:hypothetical protein
MRTRTPRHMHTHTHEHANAYTTTEQACLQFNKDKTPETHISGMLSLSAQLMKPFFRLLCWDKRKTENCLLLGNCAANGNSLPKFRDNLSVPSSTSLKMGPTGCSERSAMNYHYSLHNKAEERSSHLLCAEAWNLARRKPLKNHKRWVIIAQVQQCIKRNVFPFLLR